MTAACTSSHCTTASDPGAHVDCVDDAHGSSRREFTSSTHTWLVGETVRWQLTRAGGEMWEVVEAWPKCDNGQYHTIMKLVDGQA